MITKLRTCFYQCWRFIEECREERVKEIGEKHEKEWEEYVDMDEKRNNEKGVELTINSWMDIDEKNGKVDRNNEINNESERE